jgi:hypothetical protein
VTRLHGRPVERERQPRGERIDAGQFPGDSWCRVARAVGRSDTMQQSLPEVQLMGGRPARAGSGRRSGRGAPSRAQPWPSACRGSIRWHASLRCASSRMVEQLRLGCHDAIRRALCAESARARAETAPTPGARLIHRRLTARRRTRVSSQISGAVGGVSVWSQVQLCASMSAVAVSHTTAGLRRSG